MEIPNDEVKTQAQQIISRNFNLPELSIGDFEKFREVLKDKIEDLLHHDFEKLLWVLYRVDVSESRANQLLAEHPDKPAEVLADLVIERQIQKYHSRINYKSNPNDDRDKDLLL